MTPDPKFNPLRPGDLVSRERILSLSETLERAASMPRPSRCVLSTFRLWSGRLGI